MEQMTNLLTVSAEDPASQEQASSWRSFGSVAKALMMQAESRRTPGMPTDEPSYMPIAWAAE